MFSRRQSASLPKFRVLHWRINNQTTNEKIQGRAVTPVKTVFHPFPSKTIEMVLEAAQTVRISAQKRNAAERWARVNGCEAGS